MEQDRTERHFNTDLSPVGVIAFSLGTAIGWGSLVVTSSTYLAQSGLMGSVIGTLFGAAVMIIIGRNYSYLMQIYPDAGGAYTYSREVFGHDYAFLTAWFLALTYMSVLWANATSIPLFSRYFIGPVLQFSRLYTIFGYDIYVGEILATIAALLITALICSRSKRVTISVMVVLAAVFTAGIVIVSLAGIFGHSFSWKPLYVPETKAVSQIIRIAVISPWAFIGFESVSHRTEEFSFSRKKIFRVLVISVLITTALYILVTMLSMTAYPERYGSWLEYIRDRGNLEGLEAIPAFYAANYYMGSTGVTLMMAALLSLIITSLIGNTTAVSRLIFSLGRDRMLPARFGELNDRGIPSNAVMLVAAISVLIPFVGRTAIGWIVDVTTIGATMIYGLVSAAAAVKARRRADKTDRIAGLAGLAVMLGFGLYTLIPNLFSTGSIARETYFLFIVWTILGFIFFRLLLGHDKEKRYGESIIVWVSMLSLVLFASLIWMRQSMIAANDRMFSNVQAYYAEMNDAGRVADEEYIHEQIMEMEEADTRTIVVAVGMFAFALAVMFSNHSYMNRRNKESEMIANVDPLTGVKSKHAYLVATRNLNDRITSGASGRFAVVVCDVNGLKMINDTLGHKAGDEYICAASEMICEIFDHSPVFRLGGDEFALILTGRDFDARNDLLQMLHNRSVDNISLKRVVVSGGMSEFDPELDADFHSVFERADELMYKEKMLLKSMGAATRDDGPESAEAGEDSGFIRERVSKSIELSEDGDNLHAPHLREELTNLFKKEYFWQGVAKYDELYPDTPMDAVILDINHFHMINERYGRDFGDDVLRHVGICVQNYARKVGGIACRRKVDEFEIYCPHRDDYSGITEEIGDGTEAGRVASVRLRIGVYSGADKSLRVGQRFDRAKMAADNVRTGHIGNIGYYYEGMYEDILFRERIIEDFNGAVERGEFEVYMQPKYDIRGDEPVLCGAEALSRWMHPELGMLMPTEFIPVLEENGTVFELDRYMWRTTAAMVSGWRRDLSFDLPVSLNVSRIDMMSPEIKQEFMSILREFGLSPDDIILEITESAYADTGSIINVARELHDSDPGFRLEIDDFGSGYSSLGLLSQLSIDTVKLDMAMVQDSLKDGREAPMIEIMVSIADKFGINVLAEGVETEEQYRTLRELGCGFAQGFWFSEPVPAAEFECFIA